MNPNPNYPDETAGSKLAREIREKHQEPQDTEAVWPTPWRVDGKAVVDANGTPVCFAVYGPHGPKMLAEIVAKVNALPTLVAACEGVLPFVIWAEKHKDTGISASLGAYSKQLRAALALAQKGNQ
jgi:hypothetical protein